MDYESVLNQQITVEGTAQNASLGAIIFTNDMVPIYLEGLMRWDASLLNQPVRATGTLRRNNTIPRATVNTKGERTHGVGGPIYMIEQPTITPMK